MNKDKVVADLILSVRAMLFQGKTSRDVEGQLIHEGWAIGAVREAMTVAYIGK